MDSPNGGGAGPYFNSSNPPMSSMRNNDGPGGGSVPLTSSIDSYGSNNNSNSSGGGQSDRHLNYDPRFYCDTQEPDYRNVSVEDLLPALKQLDVNQLPPDVLAFLLKSKRLDQLVAQTAQRQQQQQFSPENQSSSSGYTSGGFSTNQGIGGGVGSHHQSSNPNSYRGGSNSPCTQVYPNDWHPGSVVSDNRNSPGARSGGGAYGGGISPANIHRNSPRNQSPNVPSLNPNNPTNRSPYDSPQSHSQSPLLSSPSFALSPAAKEFVPRTPEFVPRTTIPLNRQYKPQQHRHHQRSSGGDSNKSSVWNMDVFDPSQTGSGDRSNNYYSGSGGGYDDDNLLMYQQQTGGTMPSNTDEFEVDNADCVLSTVTDTINQLTVNPADFSRCSKKTVDVLQKYLTDVDTLGILVTLIFEQSISNPNFCYSGARLCQVLERNGIAVNNTTFKNLLIGRCQEEFMTCVKAPDFALVEQRAQGLAMFFAELYLNFTIEKQGRKTKNSLFGAAAAELMEVLARRPPTLENIRCIHQTLKLIGWDLDHDTDTKVVSMIQKLYEQLSKILMQYKTKLEPRVQFLLESIFELRKKDWNKGDYSESASGSAPTSPTQSEDYDAAATSYDQATGQSQYYELPDTVEDEDFNLFIDEESEEVQDAYEEFLRSTRT